MNGDTSKPQKSSSKPVDTKRTVIWTEEAVARGAHSEHGQHKAGDEVVTEHAALLIERGFAKAKA